MKFKKVKRVFKLVIIKSKEVIIKIIDYVNHNRVLY
jgi:hypothetical protein